MQPQWIRTLTDGFIRESVKDVKHTTPRDINRICLDFAQFESIATLKLIRHFETANYKLDKHILWRVSFQIDEDNDQQLESAQTLLKDILGEWEFICDDNEAIKRCIRNDYSKILEIISECTCESKKIQLDSYSRNQRAMGLVNYAAKCGSLRCIKYLLREPDKLQWDSEIRPTCLLNAVKHHPCSKKLITFIFEALESLHRVFVGDRIMEQAICHDLVNVAQRLLHNRWHKITKDDSSFAREKDGGCHKYFVERSELLHDATLYALMQDETLILEDDGLEWDDYNSNDFED